MTRKYPNSQGVLLAIFLLIPAYCGAASAGPPDAALFFRRPDVAMAAISPSGGHVAMVTRSRDGNRYELLVFATDDTSKGVIVAKSDTIDIAKVFWINDRRLAFFTWDLSGGSWSASKRTGAFAVDRDGSDFQRLTNANWGYRQETTGGAARSHVLPAAYTVMEAISDGSDDIIVGYRKFAHLDRSLQNELPYRLNTRTMALVPLADEGLPAQAKNWLFDSEGNPKLFTNYDQGRRLVYYRNAGAKEWRMIGNFDAVAREGFYPAFIGYDGELYVTQSRDLDVSALYRYNLHDNRVEDKPWVTVVGFDFSGSPETDPQAKKILGFHVDGDAHGMVWIDERFKSIQAKIDDSLPGTVNTISCGNCLTSKFLLVAATSDRVPTRYFLFDVSTGHLAQIAQSRPGLQPAQMGERQFVHFKARDGMSIPMYMTIPAGKPAKSSPTVVLVHGGPWLRGASWEWSDMAQFLASRGYVVLEPEFRGSVGYGFKLFQAGWRQWGLAMQDDLADAATWAIEKGIANPKRIAIGGASYGGYATLMGLIKNPELFRCGFEWAGVTDIDLMYSIFWSDLSDEVRTFGLPRLIGDQTKDAAQIRETSPLVHASKLTQPLLMAHGALDPRVPIEHARKFYNAVSESNKDVEWIIYPNEGHGWYIEDDNVDFWKHVEKFLAENL